MEYTAWHIARLRDRLARFRAIETVNGRARTWAKLADDIMEEDGLPEKFTDQYWDNDNGAKVFGEALRRFVDQQQVPSLERLDAITLFLRTKGYFTDEDIQETTQDFAAALSLHRFFGAPDASGDDAVVGVFTTARKAGRNASRVHTLEIAATDRPGILRLNETVVYTPAYASEQVFMPGHLGTHAGQKTERIEGWIVRRSEGDWVALAQDRLLGRRLILTIPHASRAEKANESFLVVVRTDGYGGADAVTAVGETRAVVVAGDVSEWARDNTWAYRYRPPEMRGKV